MPWRHLLAIWVATLILVVCLLWIDFAVSPEFFWLIPYPTSVGAIGAAAGPLFRERPLMAVAIYALPLLALLSSAVLIIRQAKSPKSGHGAPAT
jgi:hypothetical protein